MDEPAIPPRAEPLGTWTPPSTGPQLRRTIAPLLGSYWAFGQFWGVWVVTVSDFLVVHRMSAGDLGLYLAGLSVMSILTMTLLSPRLQVLAMSRSIPIAVATMASGAALVAADSKAVVLVGFFVLGIGNGLIDVLLNVAGQGVQARIGRPVLQWLHAAYNVGGITGALGAGLAIAAGIGFQPILACAALALFAMSAWSMLAAGVRRLPRTRAAETNFSLSAFKRSRRLILPAGVVLFSFLVEGSMDVWSGAYLRITLDTTALVAGIAFAVFSLALALGRLTVGAILFRIGYAWTVRVSGLGAFAGGIVAALTNSPIVAGIAFLFLGFFIASAAPAAFGSVREEDGDPALAVAAMSTVGYTGFVIGPPIMGWLAQGSDLRATMIVIAACTLGVAVCGFLQPSEDAPADQSSSRLM